MINIKKENNKYLTIYSAEKAIGQLEYQLAADEAEIIDLKIDSGFRRQGYGRQLLERFINILDNKYSTIYLEVRKSNLPAINLYQKFNFKKIGERKEYYSKPKEDSILMKLKINAPVAL